MIYYIYMFSGKLKLKVHKCILLRTGSQCNEMWSTIWVLRGCKTLQGKRLIDRIYSGIHDSLVQSPSLSRLHMPWFQRTLSMTDMIFFCCCWNPDYWITLIELYFKGYQSNWCGHKDGYDWLASKLLCIDCYYLLVHRVVFSGIPYGDILLYIMQKY